MKWSELDQASQTWTIPADRAKNGVDHIVPLNSMAIAELDKLADPANTKRSSAYEPAWPSSGHVLTTTGRAPISGISKAKIALDMAITAARRVCEHKKEESLETAKSMPAWRIHDVRRTIATGCQRLGVRFEVTEALLNHVSGSRAGVAGIYQLHEWKGEKRLALELWGEHVKKLFHVSTERVLL